MNGEYSVTQVSLILDTQKEHHMQIGLLEDNPTIHEYLQTALELNGHHIIIHTYGSTLLGALFEEKAVDNAYPYDLVIIDLHLPGNLSGWDVILHIRKKSFPGDAPNHHHIWLGTEPTRTIAEHLP